MTWCTRVNTHVTIAPNFHNDDNNTTYGCQESQDHTGAVKLEIKCHMHVQFSHTWDVLIAHVDRTIHADISTVHININTVHINYKCNTQWYKHNMQKNRHNTQWYNHSKTDISTLHTNICTIHTDISAIHTDISTFIHTFIVHILPWICLNFACH